VTDEIDATLGMIEATNALADAMDGMKCALEQRGWSTPMSEQVGATFGAMLFSLMPTPNPPKKGTP
jgi:hypothetical protein